jgi:urease accessory protein
VRSRVEIVADVADDGRPVLPRLSAEGAFAVRATGAGQVHLVGTAAGPLPGDVVDVMVKVRAGARLRIGGAAATIALAGGSAAEARIGFDVEVAEGGRFVQDLPPLIVCRGARLRTTTRLALAASASADVTEAVVLGRHGEDGGSSSGRLVVDRAGRPVVRTTQRSDVIGMAVPAGAARVVLSRFLTASASSAGASAGELAPSVVGHAVRCTLAGGDLLVSAVGKDLLTVLAQAAATSPGRGEAQPSPTGPRGCSAAQAR